MLKIVETIPETRAAVEQARAGEERVRVGLVPTMGALHEGHVSLIRFARAETDFLVVSIFVNPNQFGPHEDFTRYPRPLASDLERCRQEQVDLVFHPPADAMYPPDFRSTVEVQGLQDVLEGASRPGHFRAVTTVVMKLFDIIRPDVAYFGQKDAQQFRVIEQMVRDLNLPMALCMCPTVREPDGLALSSRNVYLDPAQRQAATVLSRALTEAQRRIDGGERRADALVQQVREQIAKAPGRGSIMSPRSITRRCGRSKRSPDGC